MRIKFDPGENNPEDEDWDENDYSLDEDFDDEDFDEPVDPYEGWDDDNEDEYVLDPEEEEKEEPESENYLLYGASDRIAWGYQGDF